VMLRFGYLGALGLALVACGPLPGPVADAAHKREQREEQGQSSPKAVEPVQRPRALEPVRDWSPKLNAIVEEYKRMGVKHTKGKARAADFQVSLNVVDLDSGQVWAAREANRALIPASNMKLVTTAAALVLLGPGQDFVTPVETVGTIQDGVLQGDLVLRAAGDPIVNADGDAKVEARLDVIAQALRQQGVTRIQGDVVLDESDFAAPSPAPGWPSSNQYWQEHCALSAGFTLNGSVLQSLVTPARSGGSARVELHPAPHGLRSNYSVKSSGAQNKVQVGATVSTVTVKGSIPKSSKPFLSDFSHPDPLNLFGQVLIDRLKRGGVQLDGKLRFERGAPRGEHLVSLRSSLDAVLVPINTHSRNSVADQLLLAMGHALAEAGTREAGAMVSSKALAELGVPTTGFHQADGSGLSRDNRVTARQLTALIAGVMARNPETARVFQESLATNGGPGSLLNRMKGSEMKGRVFAKNGWITGASSLSGICYTQSGKRLAFSILIGYPPALGGLNTNCFKPMQDALVTCLVTGDA
jgi:D-alanyl-D-alanine carboxypeptidase/D-alanyl-D-alanine-endopeptidase (penicillin-binding protein 4)